jgi:Reverse transcriptase (RNA-dependent DNA polymerase)
VKTRYWKQTHKYGIPIPKFVSEALAFDKRSGTDFWRKSIEKEMLNVMPAFEFRDVDKVTIGYTKITFHMIFDVKQDLTRKAKLVAGGHQTELPKESVYSSVVMHDSVRIVFTMASVNFLQVLSGDVQNAYLNAPTAERCYCIVGPEFGPSRMGISVLIVRALFGLRSSGERWRDHIKPH